MTTTAKQYPFLEREPGLGAASLSPVLPLTLTHQATVQVQGLLDTAATVNVLPYSLGVQLGAVWEQQKVPIRLTGNLGGVEARGLLVTGTVADFPPVRLAFAWAKTDGVPLLLGQLNFFAEFDVCLFRSRALFAIRPRPTS